MKIIFKEGMGCKEAGLRIGKQYLKKCKRDNVCLIRFWNGYVYVFKRGNTFYIPTDKEVKEWIRGRR